MDIIIEELRLMNTDEICNVVVLFKGFFAFDRTAEYYTNCDE